MKHVVIIAMLGFCLGSAFSAESIFTEKNYPAPHHPVPIDKGLSEEWIDSLYNQGEKPTYTGDQLDIIAMPIGGIATVRAPISLARASADRSELTILSSVLIWS